MMADSLPTMDNAALKKAITADNFFYIVELSVGKQKV